MAQKKGGGSTRNGRDSESKRLGVKAYGGELIPAGSIIVRCLRHRSPSVTKMDWPISGSRASTFPERVFRIAMGFAAALRHLDCLISNRQAANR
jgi:hypothetical protein